VLHDLVISDRVYVPVGWWLLFTRRVREE
jgi:hypothetical protein